MIRIIAAALAALTIGSAAEALPCLNKLERGADHYRIVEGTRCWYVGDEIPKKSEFTKKKRKEVVQRGRPKPVAIAKTSPAAAVVQSDAEWLEMKRLQGRDVLCGVRCPPPGSYAMHVHDVFEEVSATVPFASWPIVALRRWP